MSIVRRRRLACAKKKMIFFDEVRMNSRKQPLVALCSFVGPNQQRKEKQVQLYRVVVENSSHNKIMIIYNRSAFGVNLLFRIRGSSVYRTIFPSLLSVGLYCLLHYVYNDGKIERERELGHPYAVGVLVGSITFLIVFRANQGYARYWEGASSTHHMMSKWMDATVHSCVYHLQCDHYKDIKPPSYFDYPELNDLFLTRDRERGQDYYQQAIAANLQQPQPQQPQHDDDHENNIDNHEEEEEDDPRLTPAMGRRNHTFPMDSKSSSTL